MSADASTPATEIVEADQDEYDQMLETLDVAIDEAARKIESGRVYDPENEKVRIKWIRALAYAINIRRQVAADRDRAEIAQALEDLGVEL